MAYIYPLLRYKAALDTALYNMNLMASPLNAEITNRIFNAPFLIKLLRGSGMS